MASFVFVLTTALLPQCGPDAAAKRADDVVAVVMREGLQATVRRALLEQLLTVDELQDFDGTSPWPT